MAREVLPVVSRTPVLAGVNGTDPFAIMPLLLRELKDMGFAGVQNFPTVGIIDGTFRVSLEETGINFASEVDMIRQAHELDLLTTPYVFSADEAVEMTRAGADFIVPHMGVTVGGAIGASSAKTLATSVALVDEWAEAARRVRKDVIVIAHGGPISSPQDVQYVLDHSEHCNGFYGASSMERLPTEIAMTAHIRTFKDLRRATAGQPA
jgi:predicted TIM-barrel enzyme